MWDITEHLQKALGVGHLPSLQYPELSAAVDIGKPLPHHGSTPPVDTTDNLSIILYWFHGLRFHRGIPQSPGFGSCGVRGLIFPDMNLVEELPPEFG